MKNIRAVGALILFSVVHDGSSLNSALQKHMHLVPLRDKGLVQEMCYGACRWYKQLAELADCLISKPLKYKDLDVYLLILIGLYQLIYMRVPAYAAITETVSASEDLNKSWARNFINAVLRNFTRRQPELNKMAAKNIEAVYAHPLWLIEKIQAHWPEHWKTILEQNNLHPPFALRVNEAKITRADYMQQLAEKNMLSHAIAHTLQGICLDQPCEVTELPGFNAGLVSVQDGAAQLAASLLDLAPGQKILDACAAPGGKTGHILECQSSVELLAIDNNVERLASICENIDRLGLQASCKTADAANIAAWWDGQPFARILLDVPCSATGVIRRHPDIKLLRQPEDIEPLVQQQQRMLKNIWPALQPGGLLVYATCSILTEENSDVVADFLRQQADAELKSIQADWGHACAVGRQILPGEDGMDGFYYAVLRKKKD